jgi:hypothetical protein
MSLTAQGQIGTRPANAYRNEGPMSAPHPPLPLSQVVVELNDVHARGRAEVTTLTRLRDHLRESLRGPIPCGPGADCDGTSLPLGELPKILAEQSAQRSRIMDEIAEMLGA